MKQSYILTSIKKIKTVKCALDKWSYCAFRVHFLKTILLGFREENMSLIDFFGVLIELWIISAILVNPLYLTITP